MDSLDAALTALLAGGGPAATTVRGLLAGMSATLTELAVDGNDVRLLLRAREAVDRLMAGPPAGQGGSGGMSVLVGRPPDTSASEAASTQSPGRTDPLVNGLTTLWSQAAAAVREHHPGVAPSGELGRLWQSLHLLFLRMSPDERAEFRRSAAEVVCANGGEVGGSAVTVLGYSQETLIPRLCIGSQVICEGLATDPQVPPPDELRIVDDDPVYDGLLRLTVPVLHLISHDQYLSHCLQVLQFRGLATLDKLTEQERLRSQIVARVMAVASTDRSALDWLERLVRAHEAVSSVVHTPPAGESSWWGQLRTRGHTLVREAAATFGPGLVKLPPTRFGAARSLTEHDIPLKVPESSGMVLACVRVWSNINNNESPGRVIYAS